jgi:ParB/RepB/Spo0J family partition protein
MAETITPVADDLADVRVYFGVDPLDTLARGRTVERLPLAAIAPDLRPAYRQPRLLPAVGELWVDGLPAPAYADLVAELLDLGRSLQMRQIQPIVVYPGSSDAAAAVRYLILVGHRRWTAAQLVGMDMIGAIVVDPPSPEDRVIIQYAENEERADFSDMERAWSLQQMKQALGDAPWDVVETRFQMSRSRRQDLLRLTAFTDEQQMQVARLRVSETQIRPLHMAVRSAQISPERVDSVLMRISQLSTPDPADPDQPGSSITSTIIARLVAKAKRDEGLGASPSIAQWARSLLDQIGRTKRSMKSARRRMPTASAGEATQLRAALMELVALAEVADGELPMTE